MNLKTLTSLALSLTAASFASHADVVITTDGAQLTGQITKIEAGVIHLTTAYAGDLEIQQAQVASFETDTPVNVRLADGTTLAGPIADIQNTPGSIKIQTQSDSVTANLASISDSWALEAEDPALVRERAEEEALRRKWSIESAFNISGKRGNTDESDYGANLNLGLKGPDDELKIFASYLYGETNDERTDDEMILGSSYDRYKAGTVWGWYVASLIRRDTMEDINFRSRSSAGLAIRLIDNDHQSLKWHIGPGYLYTSYTSDKDDDSAVTANTSLHHAYKFNDFLSMKNMAAYATQVEDTGDYNFIHDSSLEIPIGNGEKWKVNMGIMNEYESQSATDENWNTTYYTKMVYRWK
ncbi:MULTISPECIES: YdiY family protein [unclassified Lentimonas]|uniref:DUF481 domain-containing protein n=1 Tax=unclassified Lentimonas TaxID=2630993 RepID=UPI00132B927C|nr:MULTISPECIES: DUF481 domain-containing protein [unclassified Lentimonas]CAA6691776.1 Unannotated [Lentimonas sp. CC19]CAA6696316.1 Unannotated [Lentimonas sp. CC10]CAA7071268.1 Unannotated [Lentimonas sp. CC11]